VTQSKVKLKTCLADLKVNSPFHIKLSENLDFYLIKNLKNEVKAFQNKCSHMGARLTTNKSGFSCPVHGWAFSLEGLNENNSELGLRPFNIEVTKEGEIFLITDTQVIHSPNDLRANSARKPKISVHSHACLEIEINNFSILFDPWIEGTAYHGSWQLWPPPVVKAQDLQPSVIFITHPHPDHFHIPTLEQMDRGIPVYFPNFLSGIIEKELIRLGFRNLFPSSFSQEIKIGDNIRLTFLKPTSMWEDSSVLLVCDDFVFLNQNDAGAVFDETLLPTKIDLFACAFDQGASGYPLTWSNITESRKRSILQHQKKFTLNRIQDLCKRYNATFFLPFAGHWRLKYKEHQHLSQMIPHTTYSEIESVIGQETPTCFLGLMPGDSFDFANNIKATDRRVQKLLQSESIPTESIPVNDELNKTEMSSFVKEIEKLYKLELFMDIEPLLFIVKVEDDFEVALRFKSDISENIQQVSVLIPRFIARIIQSGDYNWDHISIGYFGTWDRSGKSYPTNFMRALQLGNGVKTLEEGRIKSLHNIDLLNMSLGALVELNPKVVAKVFGRYGLPCVGCHFSPSETLATAIVRHRLPIGTEYSLARELKSLV